MARVLTPKDESASGFLASFNGDHLPYRLVFELLSRTLPFAEGAVVSSLPRGGMQVVQPLKVSASLVKSYAQGAHLHDRLSWRAIVSDNPIRETDCWSTEEWGKTPYRLDLLNPLGLDHAVALPLKDPVIRGYAGALCLFRTKAQGPFTNAECAHLLDFARQIDHAIDVTRSKRLSPICDQNRHWSRSESLKTVAFDSKLNSLLPGFDDASFDATLLVGLRDYARKRLAQPSNPAHASDRLQFPDSHGDLRAFRVVRFESYPALSDGPVLMFCAQPEYCDWETVRAVDFQADEELSRLIPALRFMQDHFHRRIKLPEVAKAVHLSTFHFHRRFTELLGITPKHFLLQCQIFQTKIDLLSGSKDLVDIASESGFAHQSHFTSRFKQATGMTPTRWRRATQKRIADLNFAGETD